jgi:hypothetical protein
MFVKNKHFTRKKLAQLPRNVVSSCENSPLKNLLKISRCKIVHNSFKLNLKTLS